MAGYVAVVVTKWLECMLQALRCSPESVTTKRENETDHPLTHHGVGEDVSISRFVIRDYADWSSAASSPLSAAASSAESASAPPPSSVASSPFETVTCAFWMTFSPIS